MRKPVNYYLKGAATPRRKSRASEETVTPEPPAVPEIHNVQEFIVEEGADNDIARTIFFDQEISEESATILRAQLMSMTAEDKEAPIRLMLGSPGGGLYESLAIYDTIRLLPNPVIAICSGKVMSGGILILLACSHRVSTENTTFMMHHGHTTVSGNVIELKDQVAEIEDLNNKMLDQIIGQTKITRDQLEQWLMKDHYLNATQAKKLGLITQIVRTLEELDELGEEKKTDIKS